VTYLRLLAHPGAGRLVAVSLLTKVAGPVLGLGLLLVIVDQRGSYAVAGLALTGHAVALAAAAPVGGGLVDRYGARRVLLGYLAAHLTAYGLLVLTLDARTAVTVGCAALLGATTPPAGAVVRGTWVRVVPADELPAAYAIETAGNELMFIAGPLLVGALLLVVPPGYAVGVAAVAVTLGTAVLVTVGPTAARPAAAGARGGLRAPATLTLLGIAALAAAAYGCLQIGIVAASRSAGAPAASGLLFGLLSAGALAGSLVFGSRRPARPGRLLALFCLADAAILLAGAATPGLVLLGAAVIASGLVSGPRDALQQTMLAAATPGRTATFAWLTTFMWAGYGIGTTVTGALTGPADGGGPGFVAAAVTALAAAALVPAVRRTGVPLLQLDGKNG